MTDDARALRALGGVLRALVRSGSLQPVLDEVVEAATELCSASNGRLWLLRDGLMHVVANCGLRDGYEYELEHPIAPDRSTMTGRVALTREVVNIPDVAADPEYTYGDLRGFTAFTETADPEELLAVLREYHATLGALIREHQGTLEHFAGDGIMVFFNDPVPVDEHELRAVTLALEARSAFAALAEGLRRRGTELGLGIGVAAGYATIGRIGFEGRYDYAALGRVTNLAARLSTQAAPGEILVGPAIFAAVEGRVHMRPAGALELKGFSRPVAVHNVLDLVD